MAELVYALVSKTSVLTGAWVRIPPSALYIKKSLTSSDYKNDRIIHLAPKRRLLKGTTMKKFFLVTAGVSVLAVVFILTVTTVRAEGFREGKWSMTMVAKMAGMEKETAAMMKEMENMPPEAAAMVKQMQSKMGVQVGGNEQGITTTTVQCMTNKNPVPDAKTGENCQQSYDMKGNTVNFHVICDNKNMHTESTGHVTYSGDAMEGEIETHQKSKGKNVDATIQITGKYVGPCS